MKWRGYFSGVVVFGAACSGCTMEMTDNGNGNGQSMRIEIPAGMLVGPVELTPGEENQFSDTFTIPMPMAFDSITVDMESTIAGTQITRNGAKRAKTAQATAMREVIYRIGPASEADTVCQTGVTYGPFMVAIDENAQPMSVDPPNSQLQSESVEVINSGAFAICVQAAPMNNSTLNLDMIAIDVTMGADSDSDSDDCGDPSDFSGVWMGTFSCTDSCSEGFSDDITLTVTQNGTTASYVDDGGARFEGTVCGNVFSFSNNDPSETETGTMTLTGESTAVKMSTFQENSIPFCTGDCTDNLTRN